MFGLTPSSKLATYSERHALPRCAPAKAGAQTGFLPSRGRPQVFDADHLSGHGNDLLYAGLRDALLGGGAKPQPVLASGAAVATEKAAPKVPMNSAAGTALP